MPVTGVTTGVGQISPRGEGLALLYQGIFITIVRLQRGQPIADAASVRNNVLAAFSQIEKEALRLDFGATDIEDAHFAVATFLDETVLTSRDPARAQWQRLDPDQTGRAVGGEEFFERLRRWMRRPSSPVQASVLEVFLLCLLLGYKGMYSLREQGSVEMRMLVDDLRALLREPLALSDLLSPGAELPPVPAAPAAVARPSGLRLGFQLAIVAGVVLLFWVLLKLFLYLGANSAIDKLG
jgi:type IV/VI secretion system ImpK/VasF family protein